MNEVTTRKRSAQQRQVMSPSGSVMEGSSLQWPGEEVGVGKSEIVIPGYTRGGTITNS